MRAFSEHHPVAVAAYFLCVSGVVMLSMDPALLLISLAGAMALYLVRNGLRRGQGHLAALMVFLVTALVNPLVSHGGVTVLFVMNHNPITLEAVLYGLAAAAMLLAVLYWFRSFAEIMTSDRLLCLFGALSPRLALILSMALRYVPLFTAQLRRTQQAQKALGLYREENLPDRLRGGLRVFSVMVTWALENGVITADSMTARGYGVTRRTHFSVFRFTWRDALLTALSLLLGGVAIAAASARGFAYYPALAAAPVTALTMLGYAAYGLLAFLPLIIDGKETIRWRFLRSGI